MALLRSKRGSQFDQSNYEENDGPRVSEGHVAAAKRVQQEENADGGDGGGAHKALNGAALATAFDLVAHETYLLDSFTCLPTACGTGEFPLQSAPGARTARFE